MVCHPAAAPEGDAPATGRDIKALDLADKTRDPASIHPYDGPVPFSRWQQGIGPRWVGLLPTAGGSTAWLGQGGCAFIFIHAFNYSDIYLYSCIFHFLYERGHRGHMNVDTVDI